MRRLLGISLLLAGASATCIAGLSPIPEVDPASGGAALTLITGALLIIRGRRRK